METTLLPLRERKDDLRIFISHFIEIYKKKYKKDVVLSKGLNEYLLNHTWPGNIGCTVTVFT